MANLYISTIFTNMYKVLILIIISIYRAEVPAPGGGGGPAWVQRGCSVSAAGNTYASKLYFNS